jgi:hypothetical protein
VYPGQALQMPAAHSGPSLLPTQIRAEPHSSMNPLPDPRFAPHMRPIFTSQSSREQEMRESVRATDEQRLDGVKKVKHTVTVCAWLSVRLHSPFFYRPFIFSPKENDGPEESVQQGGFVWPKFCLSPSVLTDAGFHNTNENTWYQIYNRSRRSWQRVKVNHFLSVDTSTEILIKAIDVKICPRLEEYITTSMKAADTPHFRTNLSGERASVKAKVDRKFLEVNQSTPHASSTSKRKSKRARKVASTSKQLLSSGPPTNVPTKAISISSSSPSPRPTIPHSLDDIIHITDSDSSDMYCKPVKRQKAVTPINNQSRMTLHTVVKQEQLTSTLTPTPIPPREKQWPSDYPILDIVHVLHSCKPPPQGTTVAQHFYSLTGVPFKSSTYYDAWSKWDKATQEQRDNAERCSDDDLWKDFAVQVPLQKLKVARQRVRRHQHTADAEESNGSIDSDTSSDSFNTTSSN